jgi:hypothetical protein
MVLPVGQHLQQWASLTAWLLNPTCFHHTIYHTKIESCDVFPRFFSRIPHQNVDQSMLEQVPTTTNNLSGHLHIYS